VACQDTATAVLRVKENNDEAEAAIAGRAAAELYGMSVLKEGIETSPRNFTRFVVISAGEFIDVPKNKSSLIFSVSDQPGSLYEALKIFAERQINLVKLESRPIHSKPWEYLFYTLIFSVSDQPGSLYEALKIFAERQINLVKLESRPIHSKPWEYLFYTDIEVDIHDPEYRPLLQELDKKTEFLKILGCYAKGLDDTDKSGFA